MVPAPVHCLLALVARMLIGSSAATAEERYEIHITDGTIFPNPFSCKERHKKVDIEQRVYKFVGKTPIVRVLGATIQVAAKEGGEFYDPVFVWRDEEVLHSGIATTSDKRLRRAPGRWIAWFRADQPDMWVLVGIDSTKKPIPHASVAIVDHSKDSHCGEHWKGTAKLQKTQKPGRPPRKTE